jgi:hypothetical protein
LLQFNETELSDTNQLIQSIHCTQTKDMSNTSLPFYLQRDKQRKDEEDQEAGLVGKDEAKSETFPNPFRIAQDDLVPSVRNA